MDCAVAAIWSSAAQLCTCEMIRDLRDLTRMRSSLTQEASRIRVEFRRLEDANIKLASVATKSLAEEPEQL